MTAEILLVLWGALEVAAQLPFRRVWRIRWLPGGRGGICLHPLMILVAREGVEDHEAVHGEQMARLTWTGFLALYGFSGRWRARLEAEAYAAGLEDPSEDEVQGIAARIRGRTYFRSWWPGRDPGQAYVVEQVREALT